MNFEAWYSSRYIDLVRLYGVEYANQLRGFFMDAFIHGRQYGEEVTYTPLRFSRRPYANEYYELGNPDAIVGSSGPSYDQIVNRALTGEWDRKRYFSATDWAEPKQPITCKSCGVVMVDADGKSTLIASDNPEYCLNCKP